MRCCLTTSWPTPLSSIRFSSGIKCAPSTPHARRQYCRNTISTRSLANADFSEGSDNVEDAIRRFQQLFGRLMRGTARHEEVDIDQLPVLTPRQYQKDLVDLGKGINVIITLPTGSGKTLVAAEIIRSKLPTLKAANQVAVFLAPTNPLADQHHLVLRTLRTKNSQGHAQGPLKSAAFHGDTGRVSIGTWDAARWKDELKDKDVVVMTPELLLHCLAHGSLKLSQIGVIVFDEAHHCASDHPYAQFMEDFYHTADVKDRPQIVGLTASPVGVEGLIASGKKKKKSKGKGDNGAGGIEYGLQDRMNARLITLTEQQRPELKATTPVPRDEFVDFDDQEGARATDAQLQAASSVLEASKDCMAQAKKCSMALRQLQSQAALAESGTLDNPHRDLQYFAGKAGPSCGSIAALAKQETCCLRLLVAGGLEATANKDRQGFAGNAGLVFESSAALTKQMNGVKYCLEALGPWGAAAAAHLDLLSAVPDSAGDGEEDSSAAVPEEGQDDAEAPAAAGDAGGDMDSGRAGMSDMELAKLMQDDDLGKDAPTLIGDLRVCMAFILQYLQNLSTTRPGILTSTDISKALKPSNSGNSSATYSSIQAVPTDQLAVVAAQLLALLAKSSVLLVITLLAELLVADQAIRQSIVTKPELHAAAGNAGLRAEGFLQQFSQQLLQQVPYKVLQAQIWPALPAPAIWPSSMPPLLSPKVKRIAQLLAEQQAAEDARLEQAGKEDRWASIVFVETKLTALVLYKLLDSCPDMRQRLRAGYLVGNTEAGGGTDDLGMSHSRQREIIGLFREGKLNFLVCTNIGSEGMDFRQCQMVVAYDPPQNVTQYIQARGRARAAGSIYAWMRPSSYCQQRVQMESKHDCLIEEAATLEAYAAALSSETRRLIQASNGRPPLRRTVKESHSAAHLQTPEGGLATMRLAQVLLAGYCARLPGTDSYYIPQAWYKTTGAGTTWQTSIYLPPNASSNLVVRGDIHSNQKSAKNAAALKAIRQLYEERKMNGCLFPSWGSNRKARQLEAEKIEPFKYSKSLQDPLAPKILNFQQQQQTVVLHLHSFHYVSAATQQQQQQGSARDVLYLAVGAPLRCKAVPGSSSAAAAAAGQSNSFGVLTWAQLPGAVAANSSSSRDGPLPLEFPAWLSQSQEEPSTVCVTYDGHVTLSAIEMLVLMRYQEVVNTTVNWSNKKLLGMKHADSIDGQQLQQQQLTEMQQQFGGAFKPLNPSAFNDKAGLTALAQAAAAAAVQGAADVQAAAAAALQGAGVCYLFAPLQQQQQQSRIDWQAITAMAKGVTPAAALLLDVVQQQQQQQEGSGVGSKFTGAAGTAASMAEVPAAVTPASVHAASAVLQDRVLLAGHSSQLYRCKAVASEVTPATPMPSRFEWSSTVPVSSSSSSILRKRAKQSADTHAEYFQKRYNLQGFREDLPMLEISQSGRQKALQLVQNPLKPPQQQPGAKRIGAGHRPEDLNAPDAAVAAVDFDSLLHRGTDATTSAAAAGTKAGEEEGGVQGSSLLPMGPGAGAAAATAGTGGWEEQDKGDSRGRRFDKLYLPLELCWVLPLPAAAWRELQLLPAFMYRINSLLRLQQMQQQLCRVLSAINGSSSSSALLPQPPLLMAAVTAPGALEVFDMEGLEYLGDVVLKMLTTNYLLQVNPVSVNEGELSVQKATIIRNVALARKAQEPTLSLQHHLHLLPYNPDQYTPTGHMPAAAAAAGSSGSSQTGPIGLFLQPLEGSKPGKRLADCVEALIGAVYLSAAAKAGSVTSVAGPACGSVGVSSEQPVSEAGLAAAAAFCEATGVLPEGSAALACRPCLDAFSLDSTSSTSSSHHRQQQQADLQRLQQNVLGHSFSHPALLQQALTHVSRFGGVDYQRLEFLGDSVLDLYVSSWLMLQLGQALQQEDGNSMTQVYAPAELTWRRAALVNNINLARAAAGAQLQRHLAASSRQLMGVIRRFAAAQQPQDGTAAAAAGVRSGLGGVVAAAAGAPAAAAAAAGARFGSSGGLSWGEEDHQLWQKVWVMKSFEEGEEDENEQSAAAAAAAGTEGQSDGDSQKSKLYAPKALADIVESLVGAVLVGSSSSSSSRGNADCYNWAAAWQVVQRLLPSLRS